MNTRQLLGIKIGNTNIAFGLFRGLDLVKTWRVETRPDKTIDEYASLLFDLIPPGHGSMGFQGLALVSVVPSLTTIFQELSNRYFGLDAFNAVPGVNSGVEIRYEDQRALGADRFVAVASAKHRFGAPALVVDLGTATTFNALDADGRFVGGAIAPGVAMSAEALHQFTARLPLADLVSPAHALASSTRDSLRSGLVFGYAGLIEGLVARLRAEMNAPRARVIATGGLAQLMAPHCPSVDVVDPDLVMRGLAVLYEMNVTRNQA